MSEWRTMDDFPRDGSHFLVYRPVMSNRNAQIKHEMLVAYYHPGWDRLRGVPAGEVGLSHVLMWMPLPKKPFQEEE